MSDAETKIAAFVKDFSGDEPSRTSGKKPWRPTQFSAAGRQILRALLVAHPDPLPIPTLLLVVWPADPERRSLRVLFNHVSHLRQALRIAGSRTEIETVRRNDGTAAYRVIQPDAPAIAAVGLSAEFPRSAPAPAGAA